MSKPSGKRLYSPPMVAKYAYVNKPDTKYKEEGQYRVQVVVTNEALDKMLPEITEEFNRQILNTDKFNAKQLAKLKALDIRECLVKNDDGNTCEIAFKSKFQPTVVGPDKTPWDDGVWSSDTIRVAYTVGVNATPTYTGVTLYFQAVQVLTKGERSGSGGDATAGFDDTGDTHQETGF